MKVKRTRRRADARSPRSTHSTDPRTLWKPIRSSQIRLGLLSQLQRRPQLRQLSPPPPPDPLVMWGSQRLPQRMQQSLQRKREALWSNRPTRNETRQQLRRPPRTSPANSPDSPSQHNNRPQADERSHTRKSRKRRNGCSRRSTGRHYHQLPPQPAHLRQVLALRCKARQYRPPPPPPNQGSLQIQLSKSKSFARMRTDHAR